MSNLSQERVATLIQREVVGIINGVILDKKIGYINVTEVRVTKDKSFATIYYTILSDDEKIIDKTIEELEKNKAKIRMDLADKIRNLRRMPELIFKFDESLAYGNKIEKILKTIKE
ncbi:MAG: 30S ribosome-binding factor RbfA [Acholeplasmataceae bacterium]|jgi:ribosome-binding factor A|nr:30S ribosome-binding factor RbfA [Acholeplasmataceae bacterium]